VETHITVPEVTLNLSIRSSIERAASRTVPRRSRGSNLARIEPQTEVFSRHAFFLHVVYRSSIVVPAGQ
jgi:hypothetical protein